MTAPKPRHLEVRLPPTGFVRVEILAMARKEILAEVSRNEALRAGLKRISEMDNFDDVADASELAAGALVADDQSGIADAAQAHDDEADEGLEPHCSFCGRLKFQGMLHGGPACVNICEKCVADFHEMSEGVRLAGEASS